MLETATSSITISIIIPAYNVERYIEDCLKSIIKQKFTNYEVIIINDGSTDGSKTSLKGLSAIKANSDYICQIIMGFQRHEIKTFARNEEMFLVFRQR